MRLTEQYLPYKKHPQIGFNKAIGNAVNVKYITQGFHIFSMSIYLYQIILYKHPRKNITETFLARAYLLTGYM